MNHSLFAYGSLQAGELIHALIGRHLPSQKASLSDYACFALRECVYPGLRRQPGALTHGVLYKGLGPRDLALFDAYEDDFYQRRSLTVLSHGEASMAEVYVVREEHDGLLAMRPWDYGHFRATALNEFVNRYRTGRTEP